MMAQADLKAQRRDIIHRYCRLTPGGKPVFCNISVAEIARRARSGIARPARQPIIYDTLEAARAAAAEMFELDGIQQRAYPCPRSHKGHFHLRVSTSPAAG